jgi:hypothetical protein
VKGDWTGTGVERMGVFNPTSGQWILDNGDGTQTTFALGSTGAYAVPVVGDWNGSGTTKVGTFNTMTGYWDLDMTGSHTATHFYFAVNSLDEPIVGQWTGGLQTKIGIFNAGCFSLDMDGSQTWSQPPDVFGCMGVMYDQPLVGEWQGGGVTRVGIYRPSNQEFALDWNGNATWDAGIDHFGAFGALGDRPIVGDWTGTGVTRIGIFRASAVLWAFDINGNLTWDPPTDTWGAFGVSTDTPIVGRWPGIAQVSTLSDLQDCIGTFGTTIGSLSAPNSLYNVCELTTGRYAVNAGVTRYAGLTIERSEITMMGGGGPGDTTLYRNLDTDYLTYIIYAAGGPTNVTVSNFTIDGNRYGFGTGVSGPGINCLPWPNNRNSISYAIPSPIST